MQGHVDGVGGPKSRLPTRAISAASASGSRPILAPLDRSPRLVAVDGISLTIAALDDEWFDVQVIPHTWAQTTLAAARVGDALNLECDLVGKYVVRLAMLDRRGRLPQTL